MVVIIPARMASKRLHGKPLLMVRGIQLVKRVYNQCLASGVESVFVATDSPEISAIFPKESVIMTSSNNKNGTERVAEAVSILKLGDNEIVMNVQGDMPFIPSSLIGDFASYLECLQPEVATVARVQRPPFCGVSVAVDSILDNALYFSRSTLVGGYWHIGIYGYSVRALKKYKEKGSSNLELSESLEQLRFLDHRLADIKVMLTQQYPGVEINTPQDLLGVNKNV